MSLDIFNSNISNMERIDWAHNHTWLVLTVTVFRFIHALKVGALYLKLDVKGLSRGRGYDGPAEDERDWTQNPQNWPSYEFSMTDWQNVKNLYIFGKHKFVLKSNKNTVNITKRQFINHKLFQSKNDADKIPCSLFAKGAMLFFFVIFLCTKNLTKWKSTSRL